MMRALISFVAAAFILTGCVSFGGKAPSTLLTLTAEAQRPADTVRTAQTGMTLIVMPLGQPQILATDRVAVRTSDTSIAYLADARWNDVPARLFSGILAETIAARTNLVVLDRRQSGLAAGAQLMGTLSAFELDAPHHQVTVRYDATLLLGNGQPLLTRRFETHGKTVSEKPVAVAQALNEATNRMARDVSDWISSANGAATNK